jgi:hypothetical protein
LKEIFYPPGGDRYRYFLKETNDVIEAVAMPNRWMGPFLMGGPARIFFLYVRCCRCPGTQQPWELMSFWKKKKGVAAAIGSSIISIQNP